TLFLEPRQEASDLWPRRQPQLVAAEQGLRGIRRASLLDRALQLLSAAGETRCVDGPGLGVPTEPEHGPGGEVAGQLRPQQGARIAPQLVRDRQLLQPTPEDRDEAHFGGALGQPAQTLERASRRRQRPALV